MSDMPNSSSRPDTDRFTWVNPSHPILVPDRLAAGSRRPGWRRGCPPCGGGYVMPGASYVAVTSEARPGRILLAEQQVLAIGPPRAAQLHRRPPVASERPRSA